MVIVFVVVLSLTPIEPSVPEMVIVFDVDVLDKIVDVFVPPTPTLNKPSFVTLASTAAKLRLVDDPVRVIPLPAVNVTSDVLPDISSVKGLAEPVNARVCISFVALASVAVNVRFVVPAP